MTGVGAGTSVARAAGKPIVLVRGVGDVGSAVAQQIFVAGYAVAMHDDPAPTATRRTMAFADALFDGAATLAGVRATLITELSAIRSTLNAHAAIPIATVPFDTILAALAPDVLIDARMRKRAVPEPQRALAPLTIGLGPNFVAGETVDLAIETAWGDDLGAVLTTGMTRPLAGEPRALAGHARDRFVYAPRAGIFRSACRIGDPVVAGAIIAHIDDQPLRAPLTGTLRGLTHDAVPVARGTKVIEVDPRGGPALAGLGERPARIAAGVLDALARYGDSAATTGRTTMWKWERDVDSADASAATAPINSPWAVAWEALVAGRDGQRGADQRDGDPRRDPWAGRAGRFAAYSQTLPDDDPLWVRLRAAVRPGDMVLDVGAGAGRYALPLAALAREVVAVEPSPAMRGHLDARLAAAGVDNVRVVGAAWPEATVPPAEVTVCAHVVYGVRRIAPFLRALDDHTRRLCLVAIRVDQHPGLPELAQALFGEDRVRQPALLDLYGALLELGIAADVQIIPTSGGFRFADCAEATAHFRDRLRVPPGSSTEARLRELVAARLIQESDGRWRWPTPPPRNAIVSWQKGE